MTVIIDYGMGNLRSILFKLQKSNINAEISSDKNNILKAKKIILPGVGHFAEAMKNLEKRDLISVLNQKVLEDKTPIMGICLGAQLLTEFSEEGNVAGLGWIKGRTTHFDFSGEEKRLPVPHVGWNTLKMKSKPDFWPDFPEDKRFYFTHSYYMSCERPEDVVSVSTYGHEFASSIGRENILGVQFHPEKSHYDGFELVKRFAEAEGAPE